MSSALPTVRFQTTLKGIPGTLVLTATTINWLPEDPQDKANRQTQALSRIETIFTSKAGSPRTSLKVVFVENVPPGGLTFLFTHPESQLSDRQTVQDRLTLALQQNKAASAVSAVAGPSQTHAGPSGSAASAVLAATGGKRKAGNETPGSGSDAGRDQELHELRKRVLRKNPTLKVLHRELVSKGRQITEDEFWDGREAMIQAERMTSEQIPGRPSRLLDDRFGLATESKKGKDGAGGTGVGTKKKDPEEKVVTLSTELTKEIFDEFPVVQDAWAKHVPAISEAAFWTRYFQSQLWEQHRASVRSSNQDDVPKKKDDIFDQYLEEPDWALEPRTRHGEHIERFLDLDATEEDHGESGNSRDVTMQAGKQRTALPLIRRFNEHSHKLLHAGREEATDPKVKRARIDKDDDVEGDVYNEIDLEDLHGPAQDATIPLNVQDRQSFFEGQGTTEDTSRGIMHGKTEEELAELAGIEYSRFDNWSCNLARTSIRRPTADAPANAKERYEWQKKASIEASAVIKEMTAISNSVMLSKSEIPAGMLSQVISCHNATCEFLRQYWTAVLPSPPGALNPAGPAQKSAKAAKMAGYLSKTADKVAALVTTAERSAIDPSRVQLALDPTLAAVDKALAREATRKK